MINPESKPAISREGLKKAAINLAEMIIPRRAGTAEITMIAVVDGFTICSLISAPYLVPFIGMSSVAYRYGTKDTKKG